MTEVEIRAKIDNVEEIKKKLEELGAKFFKFEKQVDRVFGHSMFMDDDNMLIEGGLSARIREVDNKKALEFKEIVRQGAGIEISSELDDVETGLKFFEKLKFKEAFTVSKSRESYSYKDFTICLDKVDQLGNFIEVEKMITFSNDKESARKECLDLLNILSPNSEVEHRKYGDLMQEIINKNK